MRLGVKVGPVYASTRVGGRSRLSSSSDATLGDYLLVFALGALAFAGVAAYYYAPIGWHYAERWLAITWQEVK